MSVHLHRGLVGFDFNAVGDDLTDLLGSPIGMYRGVTIPSKPVLTLSIARDSIPALNPHVFKISLRDVSSLVIDLRQFDLVSHPHLCIQIR